MDLLNSFNAQKDQNKRNIISTAENVPEENENKRCPEFFQFLLSELESDSSRIWPCISGVETGTFFIY